jgi:hypothetical protein
MTGVFSVLITSAFIVHVAVKICRPPAGFETALTPVNETE